jgi:O-antigen/teichoic acid export membrane protein
MALSPVVAMSLAQSLFFYLPKVRPELGWVLVRRTIAMALVGAGVVAVVIVAARTWISAAFSNPRGADALGLFALFLVLSVPTQLSDGIFMPPGRVGHAALFNVLNRLVVLIALALPVWAFGWRLEAGLSSLLMAQLGLVMLVWWRGRRVHQAVGVDGDAGRMLPVPAEQLRYALPIAGAAVFGAVFLQLDKFVAGRTMSPEAFAVYANGAFENPVVALLASASGATVATELVRLHHDGDLPGFVGLWRQMFEKLAIVVLPMGVFMFVFASELVVLLFSQRYAASGGVFRVYVLLTPVRIVGFSTLFMAINRNRAYLVGHLLACGAVVIAAVPLLRVAGILGPAIAMVLVTYGLAGGFLALAARALGTTVRAMLPLRLSFVVLASSVALALGVRALAVNVFHLQGVPALMLGGVLFLVGLGAAAASSRTVRAALRPS